mmetsp:Transcript_2957/g.12083  ORF Transcript_2957/g.12083 Transcript_2957/m.12083 type:complete len:510 (-) Transcript_2957:1618-3147(-)
MPPRRRGSRSPALATTAIGSQRMREPRRGRAALEAARKPGRWRPAARNLGSAAILPSRPPRCLRPRSRNGTHASRRAIPGRQPGAGSGRCRTGGCSSQLPSPLAQTRARPACRRQASDSITRRRSRCLFQSLLPKASTTSAKQQLCGTRRTARRAVPKHLGRCKGCRRRWRRRRAVGRSRSESAPQASPAAPPVWLLRGRCLAGLSHLPRRPAAVRPLTLAARSRHLPRPCPVQAWPSVFRKLSRRELTCGPLPRARTAPATRASAAPRVRAAMARAPARPTRAATRCPRPRVHACRRQRCETAPGIKRLSLPQTSACRRLRFSAARAPRAGACWTWIRLARFAADGLLPPTWQTRARLRRRSAKRPASLRLAMLTSVIRRRTKASRSSLPLGQEARASFAGSWHALSPSLSSTGLRPMVSQALRDQHVRCAFGERARPRSCSGMLVPATCCSAGGRAANAGGRLPRHRTATRTFARCTSGRGLSLAPSATRRSAGAPTSGCIARSFTC